MKKWIRIALLGIGGLVAVVFIYVAIILFIFAAPGNERDNENIDKSEMIEATLEWGRLAPFPEDAEDFIIYREHVYQNIPG